MTPPDLPSRESRTPLWQSISLVWLVPLAALAIALWVGWESYNDRGPLLIVEFEEASGIHAGETELRYRDVTVGLVESVGFTEDLGSVQVRVRLDTSVVQYVDEGATFWIVQPEVTAQGVSGLDTVLSGVFIEGYWDADPGGFQQFHTGGSSTPLLRSDQEGVRIRLTAGPGTQLTENTPIIHKGIEVGRVGPPSLTADGTLAEAEGVIFVPYTRFVTTATRFWDTSGFRFTLGPNGAELDFNSIASLISGGVEFDTLVSGGVPIEDGTTFVIYADDAAARASLFTENLGPAVNVTAIFEENFAGLTVGANVLLDGVRVGEVANLNGVVDEALYGDARVRLSTTLAIRPSSLGLQDPTPEAALAFLEERVAAGLRARLATASLLTGGLLVDLVTVENPEPAALDLGAEPFPILPVAPAEISDVAATAEGVMERINNLPIEELLASATAFLDAGTSLVLNEDLRAMPGELNGLFGDVRGLVNSDEVQGLPVQAAAVMEDIQATITDLREVAARINDAQAIDRLLAAVDSAGAAADGVKTSVEGVPALVERLTAVAEKAETLELDALIAELTGTATEARALLAQDSTKALPESINATLSEFEAAIAELREAGTIAALNRTLASAEEAAAGFAAGTEGLPELVERITSVAEKADNLALEELMTELTEATTAARVFLTSDGTQSLPEKLGGTLTELEAAISELRAGGTVENVNATLASARGAAEAIEEAAADLPAIVRRLGALTTQASTTLGDFDQDSDLNRAARAALRDIQDAARAIEKLANTLERRPNSVILGR